MWTLGGVRAILANPRHTGRQVWNRQRTDADLVEPGCCVAEPAGGCWKSCWPNGKPAYLRRHGHTSASRYGGQVADRLGLGFDG